jgi:tartrate dehydrogenase/decarboxylase/D-malate dehydrogenase
VTDKIHSVAVIPGDGIGKEVMPEGVRVMNAAAEKFNIPLRWEWFDYASADYWQQHGKMLPDDWFPQL